MAMRALPGDVIVNQAGTLDGYSGATVHPGVPGIGGNLFNAGKVVVHNGDTAVAGNYSAGFVGHACAESWQQARRRRRGDAWAAARWRSPVPTAAT